MAILLRIVIILCKLIFQHEKLREGGIKLSGIPFIPVFSGECLSIIDYLDSSSFDELAVFDLINDRHENIYHVDGKYLVPMLRSTYGEIYSHACDYLVHPDDREIYRVFMKPGTLLARLGRAVPAGIDTCEVRFRLLNGTFRWVNIVLASGSVFGFGEGLVRAYIFDIQNQKDRQAGQSSAHFSLDDKNEITGLFNEKTFFAIARNYVERPVCGKSWAFVTFDLEHFRLFNDWYGYSEGNVLLAEIGAELRGFTSETSSVAGYLGRDDFAVVMPYSEEDVNALYERIRGVVGRHCASLGFQPSAGVAVIGQDDTLLSAYDKAVVAITSIKGDHRKNIALYDPSMSDTAEQEYSILSGFRSGLQNGEVFFVLQPQCRASTGAVVGAESLARWRRADGSFVSPAVFVPILEKYGFITDLDEFIWEGVCALQRRWLDSGSAPVPISVNVSQIDVLAINVVERITALADKYSVPHGLIKVEITESAYAQNTEPVKHTVTGLRDAGFSVLMDDFGSGYSSLNMLRELPFDVIKLDGQFMRFSSIDTLKAQRIVENVVNLAKTVGTPIIVEGVETPEQVTFLQDLGCRYIQGYYFYRPMPVADFEKLVADTRVLDTGGIVFEANQQFSSREFMDKTIYSDNMLNNILGAVGIYNWDGGVNVDIVRFNQQFYELVNEPDFDGRIKGIQAFIHPKDLGAFYSLFSGAERDRLNGASGMVGVFRSDGSLGRFFLRIYFLSENKDGKLYYGSMQELTVFSRLETRMQLITDYSSDTILFLHRTRGGYKYEVVVHGLEGLLGLGAAELEDELNSGRFYARISSETAERLMRALSAEAVSRGHSQEHSCTLKAAGGKQVRLMLKASRVEDDYSDVEYIVSIREITGA